MEMEDNMKVKALSDVKRCSPTIMWFYDKFMPKIADIRTVQQRNGILSDMENNLEGAYCMSQITGMIYQGYISC